MQIKNRYDFVVGLFDDIANMLTPKETEEERKKRLAREAANNPLLKLSQRKTQIDKAVEEAQK